MTLEALLSVVAVLFAIAGAVALAIGVRMMRGSGGRV